MANTLYPGFVYIFYTSNGHEHRMTVPVFPILDTGDWNLIMKNGSNVVAATGIAAYVAALKASFPTTASFNSAELWTIPTIGADPIYRETYALSSFGTSGGAVVARGMATFSYRTLAGGLAKVVLMESAITIDTIVTPAYTGAFATLNTYLVGSSSIVRGRDTSTLIAPIRMVSKESDALRKKYFLNV